MTPLLRYTLKERVVHWLAALTYLYLLLTGLAFFTPNLWWLASILGGGVTSRFWHPVMGLVFFFTVAWMWYAWRRDMSITDADRNWNKEILRYIRNEDEDLPPVGRFNTGQKQFFWIMFFGVCVSLATGLVLWFTDSLPWSLRWLRYISVLGHALAFLVMVAGFIVHVYMGTAVATGAFSSVIRGEVSEDWARAHHCLWFDEVTRNR